MTVELFDLLSDNAGEVDHPLCEECTDTILETMDQQLKLSEEEAQQYHSFLQKLEGESEDDGHQVRQLEKELAGRNDIYGRSWVFNIKKFISEYNYNIEMTFFRSTNGRRDTSEGVKRAQKQTS